MFSLTAMQVGPPVSILFATYERARLVNNPGRCKRNHAVTLEFVVVAVQPMVRLFAGRALAVCPSDPPTVF